MFKKLYLPVGIIAVTAFVIVALSVFKPEPKRKAEVKEPRIDIAAVTAQLREYPLIINSQGILRHKVQSTLSAQVSGEVVTVHEHLRKGSRFNKGDLLLQIDQRDYQADYELAKANWLKAKSERDQEIARALQAVKDWQRLASASPSNSEQSADQQPSDLVLRKPQRAAAEAELDSAKAKLDKAKLDLERTQIRAPYDGLVLEQHVDIAQFISSGSQIASIAATEVLEVELSVSAQWRELLNTGHQVTLKRVGSKKVFPAKVVRHAGVIDEQTRQIRLIVEWHPGANVNDQLMAGDYVEASIAAKQLEQVYVVPRSALVDDSYIWVVRNERIQKQVVNVLWKDSDNIVFDRGVLANEPVNITPLGNVVSGTLVSVQTQHDAVIGGAEEVAVKPQDNKLIIQSPDTKKMRGGQ